MNGEGFSRQWFADRYGKKIDRIHDASVLGKEPSGSSLAGDVRREQVAYGVKLYKPGIVGAYTLPEAKALSRAIQRAYKENGFAT